MARQYPPHVMDALARADATLAAEVAKPRPRKYRNEPTVVGGLSFASKKEAARYQELVAKERAGEIRDLEVHPIFPLVVNDQDCGKYIGDFGYVVVATGERVVEDVKSAVTRKLPSYRKNRRLVWAIYGLTIKEV